MKGQGKTLQEIGNKFGFTRKQVHNFITRYNTKQRKIEAGIALKRKGRAPKDYVVSKQDKVAELKHILAPNEPTIAIDLSDKTNKINNKYLPKMA